jgi:hypothetical protein
MTHLYDMIAVLPFIVKNFERLRFVKEIVIFSLL